MFSGEDSENTLDDWLPALVRAADWNGWTKPELLIQLAGHLKGRARQEWSLLPETEKSEYKKGVRALRARLDTGSKALAAQDFRQQHRMRMRKSAISFVGLKRRFVVRMDMTQCFQKLEMHCSTLSFKKA